MSGGRALSFSKNVGCCGKKFACEEHGVQDASRECLFCRQIVESDLRCLKSSIAWFENGFRTHPNLWVDRLYQACKTWKEKAQKRRRKIKAAIFNEAADQYVKEITHSMTVREVYDWLKTKAGETDDGGE